MISKEQLELTCDFFRTYTGRWAICGGWAITLWLDRQSRPHGDIDIAILRSELPLLRTYLLESGWQLNFIENHQEFLWEGEPLSLPVHQIRGRRKGRRLNSLELLMNDAKSTHWHFRRDPRVSYPIEKAFVTSAGGIPIIAPEVALLYKAKYPNEKKSKHDFERTLPALGEQQQKWLKTSIEMVEPNHPWLSLL